MDIGNRLVSERMSWRRRLAEASLTAFFLFTPSTVPAWRGDPDLRPIAVLPIGEPVVPIWRRRPSGEATEGIRGGLHGL